MTNLQNLALKSLEKKAFRLAFWRAERRKRKAVSFCFEKAKVRKDRVVGFSAIRELKEKRSLCYEKKAFFGLGSRIERGRFKGEQTGEAIL